MTSSSLVSKFGAELFGTFWLVFGGCGSAIFAAKQIAQAEDGSGTYQLGIGFLGVSLAFGLTVVTMAYAVGHISGGHFNPAISLGAAVSSRLPWKDLPGYWASQVVGGLLAGVALLVIAHGKPGFSPTGHMAANGYGDHSPGHYSLGAVIIAEVLLTGFFLIVILGATDDGLASRDIWLLRSRALLARAHGDAAAYAHFRDRYRDMAKTLGFEGHIAWAEAMP